MVPLKRCHVGRDLEMGRTSQAEETAHAKALRQKHTRCVLGIAGRPVWLQRGEGQNMGWEK